MRSDTAERMDRMYAKQRHIYDLTRKFYLLGRDRLIARLNLSPGDCVAEIGCGTGRNLIAMARRFPDPRFYGIDASQAMLDTAQRHIAQAGLQGRIAVVQGLGQDLNPAGQFGLVQKFDAIVISYALTMIPAWPAVIDRAVEHLRPGGTLAIVDFGDQRGLPRWFRALLRRWLALFDVYPRPELIRYVRTLAQQRGGEAAHTLLFGGYAVYLVYRAAEA